jgi:polyphosphate kinase 2 (PPK2 family)
LQARLDDPRKHWKFSVGDLKERARWPKYRQAYEEAISRTSTEWAAWHIVPANRKWYRNLVVATTIVETLQGLKMRYPQPQEDLSRVVIE